MKGKILVILLSMLTFWLLFSLLGNYKFLSFLVSFVFAHCDTEDGPVIKAAKKALETGNVDVVLAWVRKEDEVEIKKAFEKTLSVRKLNTQAQELADRYFFETLVRIHRMGEGEPYTGIKPAGIEVEPGIVSADKAIEIESVDNLIKNITTQISNGICERFNHLMEKKKHKDESVEAGREYVKAYVTFIHYVEKLYSDSSHYNKIESKPPKHHEH